jgi:AraC-like DNA-binding protein
LKKAIDMLKNNSELNIFEISDKLGFGSSRYFSKNFKERYKLTPSEYRKKLLIKIRNLPCERLIWRNESAFRRGMRSAMFF